VNLSVLLKQAGLLTYASYNFFHLPVFTVALEKKSQHLQWRDRVGVSPSFPFKHETKFSCTYFPFERKLTSDMILKQILTQFLEFCLLF